MAAHWIQAMHMKKGALTRKAAARGQTVAQIIAHPPKNASSTTKRQINLAETLRSLGHHMRGKRRS